MDYANEPSGWEESPPWWIEFREVPLVRRALSRGIALHWVPQVQDALRANLKRNAPIANWSQLSRALRLGDDHRLRNWKRGQTVPNLFDFEVICSVLALKRGDLVPPLEIILVNAIQKLGADPPDVSEIEAYVTYACTFGGSCSSNLDKVTLDRTFRKMKHRSFSCKESLQGAITRVARWIEAILAANSPNRNLGGLSL